MNATPNSKPQKKYAGIMAGLTALIDVNEREKAAMESDMSLVHIYFKELGIVQYSRDQLYSIMDVIGTVSLLEHKWSSLSFFSSESPGPKEKSEYHALRMRWFIFFRLNTRVA